MEASPCVLASAHGKTISLPCATDRHTAKIAPRGPTFTAGQRCHILPCASVRHTANRPLCRVPHGGTRQTLKFAVCHYLGTRQNKQNATNLLTIELVA